MRTVPCPNRDGDLSDASVGVCDVDADRPIGKHRDRLRAEVDDRDDDRRHGHGGEDARQPRTVGLLAEQPDEPLPVAARHLATLDDEAFLLLELADERLVHLVELELLDEHVLGHFERPPQSTAALVVVQYRLRDSSLHSRRQRSDPLRAVRTRVV